MKLPSMLVLELGRRDLETLHHDPHCILVASLLMKQLMKKQRMRMQRMRMQRMRMQQMRMQRMRMQRTELRNVTDMADISV